MNKKRKNLSNRKDRVKNKITTSFRDEFIEHQGATVTYIVLRALIILVLISSILNKKYENTLLCILALIQFSLPTIIEKHLHITIPSTLEIIVLVFIFAAFILGEIAEFYVYITGWDTILHTTNGFLCGAIGLSLFDLLNDTEKIEFKLSPFYLVLCAFCFSMTVGILWEFFEFSQDMFWGKDMQKDTIIHTINSVALLPGGALTSIKNIHHVVIDGVPLKIDGYLDIGLIDTMKDLFVNFIGAVVFSVYGYFYEKAKGQKNTWVEKLMPTQMDEQRIKELNELKKEKERLKLINDEKKKRKNRYKNKQRS